jgi:hypothetical protein
VDQGCCLPACLQLCRSDVEKVVDMLKTDDLPKKAVFCRCWRSEKVGKQDRVSVCRH